MSSVCFTNALHETAMSWSAGLRNPGKVELKIANHSIAWEDGRCMVIDDSYEHSIQFAPGQQVNKTQTPATAHPVGVKREGGRVHACMCVAAIVLRWQSMVGLCTLEVNPSESLSWLLNISTCCVVCVGTGHHPDQDITPRGACCLCYDVAGTDVQSSC